jgi:hypothetical protein
MPIVVRSRTRRWIEVILPLYAMGALMVYFRPQDFAWLLDDRMMDSALPWAVWGVIGALSGVLALSGLFVAFFLLYSPVYLAGQSLKLAGKAGWVDRREFRFYVACFVVLCFLLGLAVWSPIAAAVAFVLLASWAQFLWRLFV